MCKKERRFLLELLADGEDPRGGKRLMKEAATGAILVDGDGAHVDGGADVLEEAVDGDADSALYSTVSV